MRISGAVFLPLVTLLALACAEPGPRRVAYGAEGCEYCHMTIADPRFGGQLVTRQGRVYVFDDPGCLAAFIQEHRVADEDIATLWVNDFLEPDRLIDAKSATYLRTDGTHTPMGSGLIAVPPGAGGDSLRAALGARPLTWSEALSSARHGA